MFRRNVLVFNLRRYSLLAGLGLILLDTTSCPTYAQVNVSNQIGIASAESEIDVFLPDNSRVTGDDNDAAPIPFDFSSTFDATATSTATKNGLSTTATAGLFGRYEVIDLSENTVTSIEVSHTTSTSPRVLSLLQNSQSEGESSYTALLTLEEPVNYTLRANAAVSQGEFNSGEVSVVLGALGERAILGSRDVGFLPDGTYESSGTLPAGAHVLDSRADAVGGVANLSYTLVFSELDRELKWLSGIGEWDEASNWDPQQVPSDFDSVEIDGTLRPAKIDLSEAIFVEQIEANGTVTLENGVRLDAKQLDVGTQDGASELTLRNFENQIAGATNLGTTRGATAKLDLTAGTFETEQLNVGVNEESEFIVRVGSTAKADELKIAKGFGNNSTVTVEGGSLEIKEKLVVGDGKPGKLEVKNGGSLDTSNATSVDINRGSRVTVSGQGSTWNALQSQTNINGGKVSIESKADFDNVSVTNGGVFDVGGEANLAGTGGTLSVSGNESVAQSSSGGSINTARVDVKDGALLTLSIDSKLGFKTSLGIENGGVLNVLASSVTGETGSAATIGESGLLRLDAGTWTQESGDLTIDGGDIDVAGASTMTVDNATLKSGRGTVVNSTMKVLDTLIVGNREAAADAPRDARLTLLNGTVDADTVIVAADGGIYGTGSLTNNVRINEGFIGPGLSPGTLEIGGDLVFNDGSILLEVGGTTAGEEYDQLIVNGNFEFFDGEILVDFIDGFAPSEGDTFDLLPVTGETLVIGTLPVEVRGLDEGFEFDFGFNDTRDVFSFTALNDGVYVGTGMDGGNGGGPIDPNAVPEPSSLLVWSLLGACIVVAHRKKYGGRVASDH